MTHWRAPSDTEKLKAAIDALNRHSRIAYSTQYRWVYFCIGIAVGFALGMPWW